MSCEYYGRDAGDSIDKKVESGFNVASATFPAISSPILALAGRWSSGCTSDSGQTKYISFFARRPMPLGG